MDLETFINSGTIEPIWDEHLDGEIMRKYANPAKDFDYQPLVQELVDSYRMVDDISKQAFTYVLLSKPDVVKTIKDVIGYHKLVPGKISSLDEFLGTAKPKDEYIFIQPIITPGEGVTILENIMREELMKHSNMAHPTALVYFNLKTDEIDSPNPEGGEIDPPSTEGGKIDPPNPEGVEIDPPKTELTDEDLEKIFQEYQTNKEELIRRLTGE